MRQHIGHDWPRLPFWVELEAGVVQDAMVLDR